MTLADPSYSFQLEDLRAIPAPKVPEGFADFWMKRYAAARVVHPRPAIQHTGRQIGNHELYDLRYISTGGISINGWLTIPSQVPATRVIIVGHGYGSCPEPHEPFPVQDAVYLWPCLRGLGRSAIPGIPQDPYYHVLYDIDKRDRYIIGGCVEDVWQAVSAAEVIFPAIREHIGYMGLSFGGGVGVLAAAWDSRIRRLHVEVPTFGHQALRIQYPTWGSAKAIQDYYQKDASVLGTLAFYDAAVAAIHLDIPVHVAAALCDPFVTPPSQFAIYNSIESKKSLYVLQQGHSEYALAAKQQNELLIKLTEFFSLL